MRRSALASAALVLLAASASWAQSGGPSPAYEATVRRYAAGEHEQAVRQLEAWSEERVIEEIDALETLWRKARTCVGCVSAAEWQRQRATIEAALMLHTDCALNARLTGGKPHPHESAAQDIASLISDDPALAGYAARWYGAMAGLAEGQNRWYDALEWAERGVGALPGSAQMQLVLGSIEETLATLSAPADERLAAVERRHLEKASHAFTAALAADPSLVEARLRLGRVALRLGDFDSARTALAQVAGGKGDRSVVFLAPFFLGRVDEAAGRLEAAVTSYTAAIALMPQCQSARIALSHARLGLGDPKTARQELERALGPAGNRLRPDPFWLYSWGPSVGATGRLEELRREASS